MYGEDPHSISQQIYTILWDYALFLVVNELRKIASEELEREVGFNGPVIRLFDAGFATTQAVAIRKIIEKPKKNPNLAVISLRRLLKDIEDNLDLMTRENYVCYDGLPYDYDLVRRKWLSSFPKNEKIGHSGSLPTYGPTAFPMSDRAHKNFDILAQVNPNKRSKNDLIKIEVFQHLESEIEKCENIKKYVDKFIAHAAAPETRTTLSDNAKRITLENLETCHKIIYEVASFISGQILWESNLGGLPVPQYDHMKNLDKKWSTTKNLKKTYRKWNEYKDKISKWDSTSLWPSNFKIDWKKKP
ncbi:MAG: hypothetical protein GY874_17915 [Desulfobacteraceae bacterium]|nr:hypothetical protein [Desulfobacteraceae bacterium]